MPVDLELMQQQTRIGCEEIIYRVNPAIREIGLTDDSLLNFANALDSYDRMEILLELEKKYDITLELDQDFTGTFGALVERVAQARHDQASR